MTNQALLAHWAFDAPTAGPAFDSATQRVDIAHGVQQFVRGAGGGNALRFDGFTTFIERQPGAPIDLDTAFGVQAWVTLGGLPWNLAPIVDIADGTERGFVFGIDDHGRAVIAARLGHDWVQARSEHGLGLNGWHHVAASVASGAGLVLYVDGQPVATQPASGGFVAAGDGGVFIGRSRQPVPATGGIRSDSHLPHDIYFDGVLDDIRVSRGAIDATALAAAFAATQPPPPAPLPERRLPAGPPGKGRFGAFYTHLKYYDAWDRRWRVGDHPDVVVRFDDEAYRLVFWRGTNYIPCWATEAGENGIWYTNEFNETWGHGAIGCAEPMSDKHCAYSHVRIIESSDVRCVIHWRYALVDVFGTRPRKDPVSKWTDWSDELYTIYPDGSGTRKITLHSTQPLDPHEFQETIVVLQPGQRPEDVIEPEALTMANMHGQEHVYSWVGGCPEKVDQPPRANIQRVNIKSPTKPFVIVSPRHCLKRDLSRSDRPVFPVYREEIRAPQLFPWWNHWPTSDLPSDGRYAVAADRAAHSSLLTGMEWEDHEVTPTSRTRVMLHGLTRHEAAGLVPLAKSWLQAPGLRIEEGAAFRSAGYDTTERCYVVEAVDGGAASLALTVDANAEHPVHNLCMLIKGYARRVALTANGQPVPGVRQSHRDTLEGRDLLLWLPISSTEPLTLRLADDTAAAPAARKDKVRA